MTPPYPLNTNVFKAEELPVLTQQHHALLIDIRSRRRYRQGHIPGSHSIPAGLLLAGELPDGELLLIGDTSEQSATVIAQLHDQGYHRQIRFLEDGYTAWSVRHRPIASANLSLTWQQGRQLIGGPALLLVGGFTQSLGLLALGLIVWLGPWALTRSRA